MVLMVRLFSCSDLTRVICDLPALDLWLQPTRSDEMSRNSLRSSNADRWSQEVKWLVWRRSHIQGHFTGIQHNVFHTLTAWAGGVKQMRSSIIEKHATQRWYGKSGIKHRISHHCHRVIDRHRAPHSFFCIYNVSVYTSTLCLCDLESEQIELGVLGVATRVDINMKVSV